MTKYGAMSVEMLEVL